MFQNRNYERDGGDLWGGPRALRERRKANKSGGLVKLFSTGDWGDALQRPERGRSLLVAWEGRHPIGLGDEKKLHRKEVSRRKGSLREG